jgi:hypothetical protein
MDFLRSQLEPNSTRIIGSEEIISCKRGSESDEEGRVSHRKLRQNKLKADGLTRSIIAIRSLEPLLGTLENNLRALEFEIPTALSQRLETISRSESQFPYSFFDYLR